MSNNDLTKEVIEIRDRIKTLLETQMVDHEADQVLADLDTLKTLPINKAVIMKTKLASVISQCKTKPKNTNIKKSANELFEIMKGIMSAKDSEKPKVVYNDIDEKMRRDVRERIRKRIYEKIERNKITPTLNVQDVVVELEEAFYRESKYRNKVSDFLKVLNSPNKDDLRIAERLLSGDLKPEQVARFTSDDYMTAAEREKNQQYREEAFNESVVFKPAPVQSELFECRKCGSKNVSYYQLQTRSADEPMTNFCTCQSCGARWKE